MHLRSGVTNFFCNSPDSKYFSLCGNNSVGTGKALTDQTWTNRHGCVLMFYSTWAAVTKLTGWLINNRNAPLHSGGCQVQDQGAGWFSSLWGLSSCLADGCLLIPTWQRVGRQGCSMLSGVSSSKGSNPIMRVPIFMTSCNLNYIPSH